MTPDALWSEPLLTAMAARSTLATSALSPEPTINWFWTNGTCALGIVPPMPLMDTTEPALPATT